MHTECRSGGDRSADPTQFSADAGQEEGCLAGAAKEADDVPHYPPQRKTARVCSPFSLWGFMIDTSPGKIGTQSCMIRIGSSLGMKSCLQSHWMNKGLLSSVRKR